MIGDDLMDPILEQYYALENKVAAYTPNLDKAKLFDAFTYADNAHASQQRKDGTPYITHPLAVANLVADLELDPDSVIAALLHDTIEDTGTTHEEVAQRFGEPVADLVEGVTKLTRVQYTSREEKQMENLRKMLLAMSKDIRVILVKICDRLHNMRTMQYQSPKKQREKALETMEIYAPIAHRLGMQRMKWELEDLSLQYLDPVGYNDIKTQLESRFAAHQEFLTETQAKIQKRMEQEHIHCTVYGRIKHIYSIYRKMYTQHKTLYEIFDLYAFRVIVDDIADCYNVLGHIHDMFNLVPDRFKDYISTPKPNMYQSLHTTVIGSQGIPFEVQIRTWQMHETAEYGIAAHWKYKQGTGTGTEKDFEWVRRLLESQQDSDAEEFVQSMKIDMFDDEVFVYTPKGRIVSLPAGSTPIDFAYAIHSGVGNSMIGAKVNNRIANIDTTLKNGDIVEVLTSKSAKGPSRDWLTICKSNQARTKIKQWFKKEKREENIVHGKASFESEMKRVGLPLTAATDPELEGQLLKKLSFDTWDDMFAAIGYGGLTAAKAVGRIRDDINKALKQQTAEKLPQSPLRFRPDSEAVTQNRHAVNGVIVEDIDSCMIKFAKCCTPVPGDPIVGFITKGFGVSIHRADCPNAQNREDPRQAARWVRVRWATQEEQPFETTLELDCITRDGLILDVAMVLSTARVRVKEMSGKDLPGGRSAITIRFEVKDVAELESVRTKLLNIRDVVGSRRGQN